MRNVGVLGAGTMGAQIAAHLANAGVPVVLLDVDRQGGPRGPRARAQAQARSVLHAGRRRARHHRRVRRRPGRAEGLRLDRRGRRRAARRQAAAARAGRGRRRPAAASSAPTRRASRSPRSPRAAATSFRRRWLGTHFFNPPRYLQLLELIPTPDTDPAVVGDDLDSSRDRPPRQGRRRREGHAELHRQPHRHVRRRPHHARRSATGDYTIEEIDAMTGPAIGRPKSATFRTVDIAGVDVLGHVRANLGDRPGADEATRQAFAMPPLVDGADQARLGRREDGPGLLQARSRAPTARARSSTLDPATMEYRPQQKATVPVARGGQSIENVRRAHPDAVPRPGQGRRVPARRRSAPALRLRRAGRPRDRPLHRRRGPRDAVGLRLGARAVRDVGRHRRQGGAGGAAASPRCRRSSSRCSTTGAQPLPRRPGCPRSRPSCVILRGGQGRERRSSRRTPAPASSTSATACCAVEFHSKMNAIGGDTIADDAGGRQGGRAELPGAGRRQRRAELLGGREPDAPAARGAGGQLGRDRPDGPRVPERHDGAEVRRRAGRRRAGGPDARRRLRDRAARRRACRRPPRPTWASSRSASA